MKTYSTIATNLYKQLIVPPGKKIKLSDYDPDDTFSFEHNQEVKKIKEKNLEKAIGLQELLYAEDKQALLGIFQGVNTAGKDGVIKHVMSRLNPQGCQVTSFKTPSQEELKHDFLWRIHNKIPPKGIIGIFNRSQYEDIVEVQVKNLFPKSVWQVRHDQINEFERILFENDVYMMKFFLYISKEEQKKRLIDRITDPTKNYKLTPTDLDDQKYWDKYIKAYEDVLNLCSTEWAPWFVIPANHKWFRDLAVSQLIVEKLESWNMKFPKPSFDLSKIKIE